jgi:DnaJ-class molecular chaperone
MVTQLRQEIAPTPASDKCDNCDGTGKIGDGRIVLPCPVCKGTGKK